MAIVSTIQVTSPTGGNSVAVYPTQIEMSRDLNEPSILTMDFEYGWDWYNDWDDSTNSVQANSTTVFTRQGIVTFRGYIQSGQLIQERGEQFIRVVVVDHMAKLQKNMASISGELLFSIDTPPVTITEIALKQATAIGDVLYPWVPTPQNSDPWVLEADSNTTDLDANISNSVKVITATTSQSGFRPLGFIKIEDEWIQYDGYDTTTANDKYRFRNCTRGALGTTAVAHNTPQTITERTSQVIHPVEAVAIEGNDSDGNWQPISGDLYTLVPFEGRFDFGQDILTIKNYSALRASYAVFDETNVVESGNAGGPDSATALNDPTATFIDNGVKAWDTVSNTSDGSVAYVVSVTNNTDLVTTALSGGTDNLYQSGNAYSISAAVNLGSVLTAVLSEEVGNGGPGLTAGTDFVVNASLAALKITRVRLGEVTNVWDFIRNLIDELGLNKSTTEDSIAVWYDHANALIRIDPIDQKAAGSQDQSIFNMISVDRDHDIGTVSTAIAVEYTTGDHGNLVSEERVWHVAPGSNIGDNAKQVDAVMYQFAEGSFQGVISQGAWFFDTTVTNNNTARTKYLFDGNNGSGMGLRVLAEPGDNADAIYMWFNDNLDPFIVDEVKVILDPRAYSDANDPYNFQLWGITDTGADWTADPTAIASGHKIQISSGLDLRYPAGNTSNQPQVEISGKEIGKKLVGVLCKWNGMSAVKGPARYSMVKEISVKGFQIRTVLVRITDSDAAGLPSTRVFAPDSYNKMLRVQSGIPTTSHQVRKINIGQATYDSAVSFGRLAVIQSLAFKETRYYKTESYLENLNVPQVTETVTMDDGFHGVVTSMRFQSINGQEFMDLRVLDFTNLVI